MATNEGLRVLPTWPHGYLLGVSYLLLSNGSVYSPRVLNGGGASSEWSTVECFPARPGIEEGKI